MKEHEIEALPKRKVLAQNVRPPKDGDKNMVPYIMTSTFNMDLNEPYIKPIQEIKFASMEGNNIF